MANRFHDPLLLAGKVIAILLQAAMVIGAVALTAVLFAALFFGDELAAEAGLEGFTFPEGFPTMLLAGVMAIGLAIVTLLFVFFGKLRQIIDTVGKGDPFQPANAVRLSRMAWLMLGVQVLILPAAALGAQLARLADEAEGADIAVEGGGFDLTGMLMVIILFILARVFRHGSAMRDDLEGTV
jgi:CBS domain containing-hemolysin-like protein